MRHGLRVLAAVLALAPGAARGGERLDLSVDGAVRLALARSETVLSAREGVRGSEGGIAVARSAFLPTLTAQALYTRSYLEETGSLDPTMAALGLALDADEESDYYQAGLTLQQPLYTGGRATGALAIAREGRAAARELVRLAELQTIRDVRRAYDRVLLARQFAAVAEEAHALARERLKVVEARVAAGAANEFERLRASVQVANRDAERVAAENGAQVAEAVLLRALSLPQDTEVRLADALDAPDADAEAPLLAEAFARAQRFRPELAQLDRRIAMQRVQARLVRAEKRPTVAGTAAFGGHASDDPFEDDHWADTWSLGVSVAWPLFDGFRARGRSIEEDAALRRILLDRSAVERGIELEVRRALVELENAKRAVAAGRQTEGQAREGLRLAEVALAQGAAREIDVSDARTELAIARRLYAQAVFDHRMALVDLAYATGELSAPAPGAPAKETP